MAFANETAYLNTDRLDSKSARIYVIGQAGVGKSSLVNCLFMKGAQNVIWKRYMKDRLYSENHHQRRKRSADLSSVKCHLSKGNSSVTVREINLTDSRSAARLDLSRRVNERRDLIIYCTRMDETRYLSDDILIMTKLFGREIWENAIIALTFANRVVIDNPYGKRSVDANKYFKEEFQSWSETLFSCLEEQAKVDTTIIPEIPILPTGTSQNLSLPNTKDWVSSFETELLRVLYRENKRLKRINMDDGELILVKGVSTQAVPLAVIYGTFAGTFAGTVAGTAGAVVGTIVGAIIGGVLGFSSFATKRLKEVVYDDGFHISLDLIKPDG